MTTEKAPYRAGEPLRIVRDERADIDYAPASVSPEYRRAYKPNAPPIAAPEPATAPRHAILVVATSMSTSLLGHLFILLGLAFLRNGDVGSFLVYLPGSLGVILAAPRCFRWLMAWKGGVR